MKKRFKEDFCCLILWSSLTVHSIIELVVLSLHHCTKSEASLLVCSPLLWLLLFLLKLKDSLSLPKSMESEAVPTDQTTDEVPEIVSLYIHPDNYWQESFCVVLLGESFDQISDFSLPQFSVFIIIIFLQFVYFWSQLLNFSKCSSIMRSGCSHFDFLMTTESEWSNLSFLSISQESFEEPSLFYTFQ